MWRVTLGILLLGAGLLAWALSNPERRRARLVNRLEVGDDAARITALLGRPGATCRGGPLDHLRDRFPTGTPPAAMEQALARMEKETAERWVFPLRSEGRAGCVPGRGATEVGLDRRRRVLWYVPVTGRVPVVVAEGYLPAATVT
ncbi:MAG TPA: hypothetical protein VHG28_23000 [Longimicrobiaceae bacterium]|nr:hypothetical protein [Longimicrobiaceae bacterium]